MSDERVFPMLETFPTPWAVFPGAGNAPHAVGGFSRGWKRSSRRGRFFPELETLPTSWAGFPGAGNAPHVVGELSRTG
ncbi:MAG TPA: hypothetical protein H9848_08430 [Candidatus Parabacteroides intestinigallinarum]|uniref:Uncharacterized protein n=1 Tax=Candidatus Parabacteroides intestinigallinarum TaxID=2838722 RepID=A0A9D1XS37_9BACT|nr:hypothetical protein [Candidatus Parabacteroides intestinigallinarum]